MPELDLKFWGVNRNRKSPEGFSGTLHPAKLLLQMAAFQALGKIFKAVYLQWAVL